MSELHIITHPIIQHKISMLRDVKTGNKEFREIVEEVATFLCYEATRDIKLKNEDIVTPNGTFSCPKIENNSFGIVPIMRAGIGMVNGMHNLIPTAKVGHIGLYRDPVTLEAVEYYCKLPVDCEQSEIFLIDPMLATGATAIAAIQFLKDRNIKNIKMLCIITCPEGVKKLQQAHPDVDIYTASHDKELNDHAYIVPGLGDAGDRLFGTK